MINSIKNWFVSRKKRREEKAAILKQEAILNDPVLEKVAREKRYAWYTAKIEEENNAYLLWKEECLQPPKEEIVMDDLVPGLDRGEDSDEDQEFDVTLDSIDD